MKNNKLLIPLEDDEKAKIFAKGFIEAFTTPAFGAVIQDTHKLCSPSNSRHPQIMMGSVSH